MWSFFWLCYWKKTIFLFASYYKVIEFFNEHLMGISLDMLLVNATVFFFSLLCSFNGKLATGSYRLETKFCVINNKWRPSFPFLMKQYYFLILFHLPKQLSHIHDVGVFATHRRKLFNVFTWRYVCYFSFSMFLVQSKSFLSEVFQS